MGECAAVNRSRGLVMKNKLILIAGHSATGKSTFAHRLSQALGIPCFCRDVLQEAMGDGFGQSSGVMNDKGRVSATVNIMTFIAEGFLQIGKVCILESNFRAPQNEQIEKLLEKYDADCLTFLFVGDMNVLWDRYLQRESERHWVHKIADQDKNRFVNGGIKAGFGDFNMGKTIKIDATDFSKISYEELFAIANQFIKSC
jgi:predicted kinase